MALCRAQSVGGSEKDLSCRCGMQVKGAETGQLMTRGGGGTGGLVGPGEMLGEGVGKPYYSVCWFPHPHPNRGGFPPGNSQYHRTSVSEALGCPPEVGDTPRGRAKGMG